MRGEGAVLDLCRASILWYTSCPSIYAIRLKPRAHVTYHEKNDSFGMSLYDCAKPRKDTRYGRDGKKKKNVYRLQPLSI